MKAPTLPPKFQPHPQHKIAIEIANLINDLLFADRIDWNTAIYYCPSGTYHLLQYPIASNTTVNIESTEV